MSSKIDKLIKMANDISDFFNADPDKNLASEGVKNHIMRSWDSRMRQAIIDYVKKDGSALSPVAKNAIARLEP